MKKITTYNAHWCNQDKLIDCLLHAIDFPELYDDLKLYYETDYNTWKISFIKIIPLDYSLATKQ